MSLRDVLELTAERDQLRARVAALESDGCARDQRTSQYCAEAEAARAECERLRGRVAELEKENARLSNAHGYLMGSVMNNAPKMLAIAIISHATARLKEWQAKQ